MATNNQSWLYRLYCTDSQDPDGELLYVGISDSPSSRMASHESEKWWWWLVDRVEWTKCLDRGDAEAKETRAIQSELPLFNRSESKLCAWFRLQSVMYLLWSHTTNPRLFAQCPFCSSHGVRSWLENNDYAMFRRNSDDTLVMNYNVACTKHARRLEWANHVLPVDLLTGFGRCQQQDALRLVNEAMQTGLVPWEVRTDRRLTLLEMVDCCDVNAIQTQLIEAE